MERPLVSAYERFRPDFARLTDSRKWPIEWLDAEISAGKATVFGNDRACIVAALRSYPTGWIEVHGLCAAGDLEAIRELIREAEHWAYLNGASSASIASRPGWAKVLADDGYAETQRMIEKDLHDTYPAIGG